MPHYYLPHTDGKTIWLRRSHRLEEVPESPDETLPPAPAVPAVTEAPDVPDAFAAVKGDDA